MMRALWISKTGMEAQQTQLDVVSHNLANVATNGFKKSHAVFEDLMYQSLRQTGASNGEQAQLPTADEMEAAEASGFYGGGVTLEESEDLGGLLVKLRLPRAAG